MDFFTRPIYLESKDNERLYGEEECRTVPQEPLFRALKERGLVWEPKDVQLFTNHKKSHTLWWLRKYRNCTLIHIDAHSDFYRPKGRDLMKMGNGEISCFNYIWYAVRDGYVNKVYWVLPEDHELVEQMDQSCGMVWDEEKDGEAPMLLKRMIDGRMPSRMVVGEGWVKLFCPLETAAGPLELEIIITTAEALPVFHDKVEMVTAATSPEFMSRKADGILEEFCRHMGVREEMYQNVLRQHEEMKSSLHRLDDLHDVF